MEVNLSNESAYEIIFKTGNLAGAFDEGCLWKLLEKADIQNLYSVSGD
jgi:hypothetical protein